MVLIFISVQKRTIQRKYRNIKLILKREIFVLRNQRKSVAQVRILDFYVFYSDFFPNRSQLSGYSQVIIPKWLDNAYKLGASFGVVISIFIA